MDNYSCSRDEAKKLLHLEHEANLKIKVGHVERFNPAFLSIKDRKLNPMFIETHRLAQFNPRGTDVSVVLDLMIHDIDIILSIVKTNVKKISASGVPIISRSPDIANARIEFDNGCVANVTASRISMKNMRKTRLFQHDCYIGIDFLEKKTEIISLQHHKPDERFNFMEISTPEGETKYVQFEMPEVSEVNAIKMEMEMFLDSIVNDKPTAVTIQEGYTPLGSPGIDRSGYTLNVYQAFIKTPAAAAGGSKSTSRKSYKKYTKKSSSRRHKNRK